MTSLLDPCTVLTTRGDPATVDVRAVEYDSRRVDRGALFFCLTGSVSDGHDYAGEALERGAVGLVCERPLDLRFGPDVAVVQVAPGTARPGMARAAAALHGNPASDLLMVGVTGTNGKTTVTHLLGEILDRSGHAATVIGTLGGVRTTPEAPELQALLAGARDGASAEGRPGAVAMEVSSHALAQSRVDGITFDVAVFTNLSHDHLDFHGTMEAYGQAKASLFAPERARRGVVWTDDPWGDRIAGSARIPVVAVGWEAARDVTIAPGRTTFVWRGQHLQLSLSGEVNVINALLAAETAVTLGVEPAVVAEALGRVPPVPGRMELVAGPAAGGTPFLVLVDYAHTPESLRLALADARRMTGGGGRVLLAFGCGGARDREKRPLMGATASEGADVVVVTSDNPRDEAPEAIVEEVLAGVGPAATRGRVSAIVERRSAIEAVLADARPGDVVLVSGKGHETYQDLGTEVVPFDDREVVRDILAPAKDGGSQSPGGR
jgi:UDP-N-acetylmuramoyl-L-alanyl-D-glutamate--2,6-diaminopimelate ligase